jgi:hypothetical protein
MWVTAIIISRKVIFFILEISSSVNNLVKNFKYLVWNIELSSILVLPVFKPESVSVSDSLKLVLDDGPEELARSVSRFQNSSNPHVDSAQPRVVALLAFVVETFQPFSDRLRWVLNTYLFNAAAVTNCYTSLTRVKLSA